MPWCARFSPTLKGGHDGVEDRNITELTFAEFNKQDTISHQKWLEVKYGTGKTRVRVGFSENKTQPLQMQDFIILKLSGGRRSLEKTMQVRKRDSSQLYALKKIQKTSVVSQAEVTDEFEIAKRSVLSQIKNPFLVPVKFVFQSPESLYLVSGFVHGGELMTLLYEEQGFDVDRIRLYTAEILCALECLHDFDIIYGSLKPQNILLDYSGHISICDFRLLKLERKVTINESCGSPYQAPEISLGQAYTEVVDWWTLGILLAEMLTGVEPSWYDENIAGINSKIESIYFPDPDVVPPLAQDISIKLFNCDPEQRLGAKGVAEIKAHPFFDDIDWHKIFQREYEPILKPNDAHERLDTNPQDFDVPTVSPKMSEEEAQKLSDKMIEQFRGMFAGFSVK
jgi:serum/glucocorticoid-regulated kinase 2